MAMAMAMATPTSLSPTSSTTTSLLLSLGEQNSCSNSLTNSCCTMDGEGVVVVENLPFQHIQQSAVGTTKISGLCSSTINAAIQQLCRTVEHRKQQSGIKPSTSSGIEGEAIKQNSLEYDTSSLFLTVGSSTSADLENSDKIIIGNQNSVIYDGEYELKRESFLKQEEASAATRTKTSWNRKSKRRIQLNGNEGNHLDAARSPPTSLSSSLSSTLSSSISSSSLRSSERPCMRKTLPFDGPIMRPYRQVSLGSLKIGEEEEGEPKDGFELDEADSDISKKCSGNNSISSLASVTSFAE
ncbi:unnamed protein product [Pseudo-nitzschia multistriata]|uniref:Uncharacterized protein n=1 Tax=Pseudo-nitzschia multistriata TaxID=183589 RepID=A0A448ZDJ6_9STRA|nr:unnamed protein product [Pseudo-nitzschia multistriata]